jgi:two-component system phosphate regulon sensor histidine kinase PhoR
MDLLLKILPWILLAVCAAWWAVSALIAPCRELFAVLRRVAGGDFRPVILSNLPPLFRDPAANLRKIAETLSQQKTLLEEEEFSLSAILESMTEGVVLTGPDLRIRQVNKAAAALFNLEGNITGLLLPEVFLSHELQGLARRASQTREVQRGELTISIPNRGNRYLSVTAAALITPEREDAEGVLLVIHDVTRLRELEAVRREFVANVSHEFRTPLSVINGYLETLEDEEVDRAMSLKAIGAMRRHADRLNRLIEDLLIISRMEEKGISLETSRSSVEPVLKSVVEQADPEIGERHARVTLDIPEGLPLLSLDPHRLEQAFANLLANALRHGAPREGEASVSVVVRCTGPEVSVSFRDNGPGIPLSDQEHVFERFYRVGGDRARQSGGTGLGLSIVKRIVLAHGGRVSLQSTPGHGATFTVWLPVTA